MLGTEWLRALVNKSIILHTVIIEDIQELFQIEDAFRGCDKSHFK